MSLETIIDDVLNPRKPAFGAGKEDGEQGSLVWLMERVGYCTASRFKDVLDFTKKGDAGAKRKAYLWELTIERINGRPVQHFESVAMQHGTQFEPDARMAYEAFTGNMVMETGFHKPISLPMIGGSPDGLIDDDGGIEIKCPFNSANHLACFLDGVPEEHIAQCQGLMWILGRKYWDFVSYDPRFDAPLNLFISRIERDEEYITNLDMQVKKFNAEVSALVLRLKG